MIHSFLNHYWRYCKSFCTLLLSFKEQAKRLRMFNKKLGTKIVGIHLKIVD